MTGDPHDLDRPDLPLFGLYRGVVLDRADPKKLGRVRVRVPGVAEQGTSWAWPAGTVGGGDAQRGFYAVPEVGAEVVVLFAQGDVDEPHYLSGSWGEGDAPRAVLAKAANDAPDVRAFETADFELVFDDVVGTFHVKHKRTSAGVTVDGTTGAVTVSAIASLKIEAAGTVEINGLVVTINGVPAGFGRL